MRIGKEGARPESSSARPDRAVVDPRLPTMTERKSAGEYAPAAQRRIDAESDSYAATNDGPDSPSSDWPFGYTYASPKTPGSGAISDARVTKIYDALVEFLADHPLRTSVTSADLAAYCEFRRSTIGRGLGKLADDDSCPIALTQWSSGAGSSPIRWTVKRVTSGDSDE